MLIISVGEEKLIWKFTNLFTTEIKLLLSFLSQIQPVYAKKKKKKIKSYLSYKVTTQTIQLPLLRSSVENCGNWVWKRSTADSLLPQAWWVWIETATIIELIIFPLCSQMLSSSMEKLFFEAQGWVVVINCFSTSKFGVSELHRIWIWHRWRKNWEGSNYKERTNFWMIYMNNVFIYLFIIFSNFLPIM